MDAVTQWFRRTVVLLGFLVFLAEPSWAAQFRNLNFEEADVSTLDLLPGWSVGAMSQGQDDQVLGPVLDNLCLGSRCVALLSDGITGVFPSLEPPEGEFSVMIQSGTFPTGSTFISQTGDLPADARSIRFLARSFGGPDSSLNDLRVFANDTLLGLSPLAPALPDATQLFDADVSVFAGLETELRFDVVARFGPPDFPESNILIDAIKIRPVPLPGSLSALMLSLGTLVFTRRKSGRGRRVGSARTG